MRRTRMAQLWKFVAAITLAGGCRDAASPEWNALDNPLLAVGLDQQNGTMGLAVGTTVMAKGFNPTNPQRGSAVVVTFLWTGPAGIITSVTDRLTNGAPVGNTYHLVESASVADISMATYVATNVQGFPDPCCSTAGSGQDSIYVVEAHLSTPIAEGGVVISAYAGVEASFTAALGAHRSASSSEPSTASTTVAPGAITADSGALVYGIAIATPVVGHSPPGAPFQLVGTGSSPTIEADAQWAEAPATGPMDPQWTWFFRPDAPGSWVASSLVLRAAGLAPPNQPPIVSAGPDEMAITGLTFSEAWSFSDPDNGPWAFTIDWGDGTTTTGSTTNPGSFTHEHTYSVGLPRSFTIRITVVDSQGASHTDTKVVSVLL